MRKQVKAFISIVLLFIITINSYSQNLFDNEHSLKFVNYLIKSNQYDYAIIELERIIYFNQQNDTLKAVLLNLHKRIGNYKNGIDRALNFYQIAKMPKIVLKEYLSLKVLAKQNVYVKSYLKNYKNNDFKKIELHNTMMLKDWDRANQIYQNHQDIKELESYQPFIEKGLSIKRKSPFLAMSMSIIIPGLGKIYTGFWRDGLFTLLSIGTTAWQSYNGFNKDGLQSFYGWFFGSISATLYLTNIYGSFKSAKMINKRNEDEILKDIAPLFIR